MPHSSGGGSSSGGSFGGSGGSFHSGGGFGGSRSYSSELHEPAYYHHWHHGCFTYVRYINGVPDYRYWDNTALQSGSARIFSIILAVIFLLSFSLPGLAVALSGIYTATPVTKVSPHARWEEVVDDEDCFTLSNSVEATPLYGAVFFYPRFSRCWYPNFPKKFLSAIVKHYYMRYI